MKSLEERLRALPEDAEMQAVQADERLRRRILNAAKEKPKANWSLRFAAPAAAFLVLAVVLAVAVPRIGGDRGEQPADVLLKSQAAGSGQAVVTEDTEEATTGLNPDAMRALDVRGGTAQISGAAATQSGIWAQGGGANFPLIGLNGRFFRLLEIENVSAGVLGSVVGQVDTYTSEPALSRGAVVSNTVQQGALVYAVRGMENALVAAEVNGSLRVFQRVSYSGASVVGSESLSDTLRCAGHVAAMELLLEAGADIAATDSDGLTALMLAATGGRLEALRLLLEYGAQVNARNHWGVTALMAAVRRAHLDCARMLLGRGANWRAIDNDGNSALSIAQAQGNTAIAGLLREAGALA